MTSTVLNVTSNMWGKAYVIATAGSIGEDGGNPLPGSARNSSCDLVQPPGPIRESCVLKLPLCPPLPTVAVLVANFCYMFAQDEAYFGGAYMQPAPPGMAPPYPTYPPPPRKWPA